MLPDSWIILIHIVKYVKILVLVILMLIVSKNPKFNVSEDENTTKNTFFHIVIMGYFLMILRKFIHLIQFGTAQNVKCG